MKENTTKNNGFTTLLRSYESATRNRNGNADTENAYTTALSDLATACTFSVLKKLSNVGGYVNETSKTPTDTAKNIRTIRQGLAKDLNDLNRLTYSTENATALEYNQDGELKRVIKDKDLNEASKKLASSALSDGIDLVNTAILTIMDETSKITDTSTDFMETPYSVRRLKRKVYIKSVDSIGGYETVQTTPIQEVYKAIRREIESNRTMQVANNKYAYIADVLKDTESDTETEVFRRLPKYSGLAYEQTDISGKVTAITADIESAVQTDLLVEKLNLTTKQAKVLQLRQSGCGYSAISTYLGISEGNVYNVIKAIQKKALAVGLTPASADIAE